VSKAVLLKVTHFKGNAVDLFGFVFELSRAFTDKVFDVVVKLVN
jgi:hypothetical protein